MEWLVLLGGAVFFGAMIVGVSIVAPRIAVVWIAAHFLASTGLTLFPARATGHLIDDGASVLLGLAFAVAFVVDVFGIGGRLRSFRKFFADSFS